MKRLIKTFEFAESCRNDYDLTGGLRISELGRLEVPRVDAQGVPEPQPAEYGVLQTYTARTKNFNPKAAISWELFQVRHPRPAVHPDPLVSTPPYEIRFRVSDGTTDMYWDGAAWTEATLDTHWNSESEVSANMNSFAIASRTIAFVINMWTLHPSVTPSIKTLKLLYWSKLSEEYDLIYESLIPELRENIRGRARFAYRMPSDATSIDLSDPEALGFESSYNITNVLEAYNFSSDSEKSSNILLGYDLGTQVVSLSSTVATNEILWIEFEYVPAVARLTSRDYSEVSSIPGLDITNVQVEVVQDQVNDTEVVIDNATNSGWSVPGPSQKDINFSIELTCDKQYDLEFLIDSVRRWAQKKVIRMRGSDSEYTMRKLGGFSTSSSTNSKNFRTAKANFSIIYVPFFERAAVPANSLQGIDFSGGNLQLTL